MKNLLALLLVVPTALALPSFTGVQPLSGSSVNSTMVAYTLNENLDYGFVTWQRTAGAADSTIHVQSLEGSELLTGSLAGMLTNYPLLVDGAVYSVSFAGGNIGGDAPIVTRTGVLYDIAAPSITSVSIPDHVYKINDTITITMATDAAGYTPVLIQVNGQAATNFRANGSTYAADYTVQSGDTDRAPGTVPVNVVLTDAAGNRNAPFTNVQLNTASIDAHAPVPLSVVATPSTGTVHLNESLTIAVTLTENATVTGTVNGEAVLFVANGASSTATYMVSNTSVAQAADTLPLSLTATDTAGNAVLITSFTSGTPAIDPNVVSGPTPPSAALDFQAPYFTLVGEDNPLRMTLVDGTNPATNATVDLDGSLVYSGSGPIDTTLSPARGNHTLTITVCDAGNSCSTQQILFAARVPIQATAGALNSSSGATGASVQADWDVQDVDGVAGIMSGLTGFINCGDGTPERTVVLIGGHGTDSCAPAAAGTYTIQFGVHHDAPDTTLANGSPNPSAAQIRSAIVRTYIAS